MKTLTRTMAGLIIVGATLLPVSSAQAWWWFMPWNWFGGGYPYDYGYYPYGGYPYYGGYYGGYPYGGYPYYGAPGWGAYPYYGYPVTVVPAASSAPEAEVKK